MPDVEELLAGVPGLGPCEVFRELSLANPKLPDRAEDVEAPSDGQCRNSSAQGIGPAVSFGHGLLWQQPWRGFGAFGLGLGY